MAFPLKGCLFSLLPLLSAGSLAFDARAQEGVATAAAPAATPAAVPAAGPTSAEPTPQLHLRSAPDTRMFGSYRVRVGISKPTFKESELKYYKQLYGNPKGFPQISVDWFPLDWYATLGLNLRFGYYTADGHASTVPKGQTAPNGSQVAQDPNGETTLTLIPLGIGFSAEFTPFDKKWIVLDTWIGYESLYFQEVRTSSEAATSSPTTNTPTATADAKDEALVNKGKRDEMVIGASVNILLNALDEQSALSSRGTLGIESVYMSPYFQIVNTLKEKGASFSRTEIGLGFTFETAR